MSEEKIMNRWVVVAGIILIQLCLGTISTLSVFTKPLVDAGWSKDNTQAVFTAKLVTFAFVMIFAGRIITKLGPRLAAAAGGVVLGLGYILGGLIGKTDFTIIFILMGIVAGAGIGLAYVVSLTVIMRWFPDKKGLVTGISITGLVFGSFLWTILAGSWGQLIALKD